MGRAYEYAWINALYNELSNKRVTSIVDNSSLEANKRAWDSIDKVMRETFKLSAISAVDKILELEPRMSENCNGKLILELQSDKAGEQGDVRDIVIKRNDIDWEIGLSIKHNHEAIKHSRLSHRLDFGKQWFDVPCSREYWKDIEPIFNKLKIDKENKTKWAEIVNKEDNVYVPLLEAFIKEIKTAYASDSSIPRKMIEYLIGKDDFYKIVSVDKDRMTLIHTFNIHGDLNKPSQNKVSQIFVPILKLPTELIEIRFKPDCKNTLEMYLNNGWQLSFRIHNASTYVEPSLKFDIKFVGMPVEILTIECYWK